MKIYFDKINEEDGGVEGHPIELVVKDDAYDPARSAPAVQEAIEGDQIFASVFQVGTPNVAGTRAVCTRRPAYRKHWSAPDSRTGATPQNFPWTLGGIPSYVVESNIWVQFIPEKFPDATRVALLTFNNDFGKTYQTAINELAPGRRIGDRRRRPPRADVRPVQRR